MHGMERLMESMLNSVWAMPTVVVALVVIAYVVCFLIKKKK